MKLPYIVLPLILIMGACSTKQVKPHEELDSFIGQPDSSLVDTYGAPNNNYSYGGKTYWEYSWLEKDVVSGASNGYATNYGSNTSYSANEAATASALHKSCHTIFVITNHVINRWFNKGNGCAYRPSLLERTQDWLK